MVIAEKFGAASSKLVVGHSRSSLHLAVAGCKMNGHFPKSLPGQDALLHLR